MERQRLLELLKTETSDVDAIGMILSNYADFGGNQGCMVSVKQFPIVAEVFMEWVGQKQPASESVVSHSVSKRPFSVTFEGKDNHGLIGKSIEILAESAEEALKMARELNSTHKIYSAIDNR